MQLTSHTDYALRVLMYLSAHPDETVTVAELAAFYHISRNHLVKVVQGLAMHKFIITTRGNRGGMKLAKNSADISVGEVVRKMENHFNIVECFATQQAGCTLDGACSLKGLLAKATEQYLQNLDNITLATIVKPKLRQHIVNLQRND